MKKKPLRKTPSGKYAVRNVNGALRYFVNAENALAFQKDTVARRRDYSSERYERRRQRFFADFAKDPRGSGWLGNIFSNFPPANSAKAKDIVEKLKNE